MGGEITIRLSFSSRFKHILNCRTILVRVIIRYFSFSFLVLSLLPSLIHLRILRYATREARCDHFRSDKIASRMRTIDAADLVLEKYSGTIIIILHSSALTPSNDDSFDASIIILLDYRD